MVVSGEWRCLGLVVLFAGAGFLDVDAEIFEDFEGRDYGAWILTGNAFGSKPAKGKIGGQRSVSGFHGSGLVNTYHGGDSATGTLTSPEFDIKKPFINFLIGGGCHPGETCLDLIVDGLVVRSETGKNDERLMASGWNVREYLGKSAQLRVVDRKKTAWGHVNVDRISFDDYSLATKTVETKIRPEGQYLAVPIDNAGEFGIVEVLDGTRRLQVQSVQWATGSVTNWVASLHLDGDLSRPLTFRYTGAYADAFACQRLEFSDSRFPLPPNAGNEPYRPQLCFTPSSGRNNDPNGLSYYNGEWHLFYQHNPYGVVWGNMHWGHAVSTDLIHWECLGEALLPDDTGTMYSGSAVIDVSGRAGFGKGAHILFYTAAGDRIVAPKAKVPRTQRIAWSTDGRKYMKLESPAVAACVEANRDPKVVWHEPTKSWVMVVYGASEPDYHTYAFFASRDLRNWTKTGYFRGDKRDEGTFCFECPDFFETFVQGEEEKRWVLGDAHGGCVIGSFDGTNFVAETQVREFVRRMGASAYSWQTFFDARGERCVNLGWAHFETQPEHPEACFNQGMTLPMEVRLIRTDDGLRVARFPARELRSLRQGDPVLFKEFSGELAEVEFSCKPARGASLYFDLRGVKISYSAHHRTLTVNGRTTSWNLDASGRFAFRVFVDRVGIEIISLDGLQYIPMPDVVADKSSRKVSWKASGVKSPVLEVVEKVWVLSK